MHKLVTPNSFPHTKHVSVNGPLLGPRVACMGRLPVTGIVPDSAETPLGPQSTPCLMLLSPSSDQHQQVELELASTTVAEACGGPEVTEEDNGWKVCQ